LPPPDSVALLRLLQLADSALPIGSLSHSLGLETLVFDADIESSIQDCPDSLAAYLEAQLSESLLLDAVVCRAAHERALRGAPIADLNQFLSALRLARESRDASLAMGRRFASLAASIQPSAELLALAGTQELHHSVAFGYTLGHLAIDADQTVAAFGMLKSIKTLHDRPFAGSVTIGADALSTLLACPPPGQ